VPAPLVTVVVPSHERPLRLRWLLNALEEQTLPRSDWRAIVVHDSRDDETETLLREHPLTAEGTLTHVRLAPGTGSPAVQRNTGWKAATSELIAFTDDDCRTDPAWLEELLASAKANPGQIVQGKTLPDPYESEVMRAPRHRTLEIHPPGPFAQTCNILYPVEMLERLGGFDEGYPAPAGEDTDLALRAHDAGISVAPAERAVVYHCVEAYGLWGMLKLNWKWQHLAYVLKGHPQTRELLTLGVFWRRSHLELLGACAGLATAPRSRLGILAALPYAKHVLTWHGRRPRGVLRSAVEAPSRVVVELGEVVACIRGGLRYRTPFL
jgi:GT2 family glycosyltransferase